MSSVCLYFDTCALVLYCCFSTADKENSGKKKGLMKSELKFLQQKDNAHVVYLYVPEVEYEVDIWSVVIT